jgi:hypothetical protein
MRKIQGFLGGICLLTATLCQAQHIKLIEGSLDALKSEGTLITAFEYDHMRVGKFDKEADYVAQKKSEYNSKEPGRGDNWARSWVDDRKYKYEPKFNELFEKYSEKSVGKKGKYTLIFKTSFTEPGFNVGIVKHKAEINGEAWIVETDHPEKVVAKLSVEKAPGSDFWGADFDTGNRISESYATAGKALGKFIKSKS